MKQRIVTFLLLITLVPSIVVWAADTNVGKEGNEAYMKALRFRVWTQKDWTAWTSQKWDKDDQSYLKIQAEIEQLIEQGKLTPEELAKYKVIGEQTLSNPQIVFRWAYAAERLAASTDKSKDKLTFRDGVSQALLKAPFPDTYSYARIRFLSQMKSNHFINDIKAAGERLLLHNPNDYEVKYNMTRILSWSPEPEQQVKAFEYAQDLVKLRPFYPSSHAILGARYLDRWRQIGSQIDANKAIAAYQKYLELASANADFRDSAQHTIKMIQNELAQ